VKDEIAPKMEFTNYCLIEYLIDNIPSLLGITKMSIEVVIDDLSLDEAEDSETASGEAIYTSEARGSDEAG